LADDACTLSPKGFACRANAAIAGWVKIKVALCKEPWPAFTAF